MAGFADTSKLVSLVNSFVNLYRIYIGVSISTSKIDKVRCRKLEEKKR